MDRIDINAEVQSALPAVLERMRSELADRIAREAQTVAIDEVRKAAQEWALAVLVPEIKAQLEAGKSGMLKQAANIGESLGDEIGKALTAQALKALSQGYNVRAVAEALFKGY